MEIPKTVELLRIYTLDHGKGMSPDDLEAHVAAIAGLNTLAILCHQFKLMREALEKTHDQHQPLTDVPAPLP
jgi:hypothetical protein